MATAGILELPKWPERVLFVLSTRFGTFDVELYAANGASVTCPDDVKLDGERYAFGRLDLHHIEGKWRPNRWPSFMHKIGRRGYPLDRIATKVQTIVDTAIADALTAYLAEHSDLIETTERNRLQIELCHLEQSLSEIARAEGLLRARRNAIDERLTSGDSVIEFCSELKKARCSRLFINIYEPKAEDGNGVAG